MLADAVAKASFSLALFGIPERDSNALMSGLGIPCGGIPPIPCGGIPGIPGGGPPIMPGIVGGIIGGISLYARRSRADLEPWHRHWSAQLEAPCSPCCPALSSLWNTAALHRASLWCCLVRHPYRTSL